MHLQLNLDRAKVRERVLAGMRRGCRAGMETVLERAREKVPVDTGRLRDSGEVREENDRVLVVFDTPYAERVHEDLAAYHPRGQAGYLSDALAETEREQSLIRALRDAVGEALS